MRYRKSEEIRELEDELGIINYSAIRPMLIRRRCSGRWRVTRGPMLRPMSFGYVGWIAFLVFWIVFGRAMVFFFMMGPFASPTQGLEITLARTVETAWDLERAGVGLVVLNDGGDIALDPERHLVYRLHISNDPGDLSNFMSQLSVMCDESWRVNRIPTMAVSSSADVSYQDVVATIDSVRELNYSYGCEPSFVFVSEKSVAATHNNGLQLSVTPLATASVAPAAETGR